MMEPETLGLLEATPAARAELRRLRAEHGPLMLVQSGGCCDGSLPICLPDGELLLGDGDLCLGEVEGCRFHVDREQWARWRRPAFVVDVAEGAPEGFSLGGRSTHFVSRTEACPV
jgi:uncharacterized protein (DUF779 family)